MRMLFVIVAVIVLLTLVGWLRFSSPGGNPTIQVDVEKVEQDTTKIIEKSKAAVNKAAEEIDASIESETTD